MKHEPFNPASVGMKQQEDGSWAIWFADGPEEEILVFYRTTYTVDTERVGCHCFDLIGVDGLAGERIYLAKSMDHVDVAKTLLLNDYLPNGKTSRAIEIPPIG